MPDSSIIIKKEVKEINETAVPKGKGSLRSTVLDEKGVLVTGVTVSAPGTTIGAITDADGYDLTYLIDVLNQINEAEKIHLDGDFRTLVPLKHVDYGKTLSDFEDFIINHLKDRIPS